MALDFLALLPSARAELLRVRVAAEVRDAERLHGLQDRWLAQAALNMAREVRRAHPRFSRGDGAVDGYTSLLLWQVVPYLAHRLGGCALLANEAGDARFARLDDEDLRDAVATIVVNASEHHLVTPLLDTPAEHPARLLTREVANGNVVAMLLDRLAPPHASSEDRCARRVREVSRLRGLTTRSAWSPDMQRPTDGLLDLDDSGAARHAVEGAEDDRTWDDSGALDHRPSGP